MMSLEFQPSAAAVTQFDRQVLPRIEQYKEATCEHVKAKGTSGDAGINVISVCHFV